MAELTLNELSGPALDWATAKALGKPIFHTFDIEGEYRWLGNSKIHHLAFEKPIYIVGRTGSFVVEHEAKSIPYTPTTNPIQAYEIMRELQIAVIPESHDGESGTEDSERWYGNVYFNGGDEFTTRHCESALIAICKAAVGTVFGDIQKIYVPDILVGSKYEI